MGTAGKNYAIIIDEAHSSQSGEASKALKKALADISELGADELQGEEHTEEPQDLLEQRLYDAIKGTGTAPQFVVLCLYCSQNPLLWLCLANWWSRERHKKATNYAPFHTYSMLQAIEEGFILDVLKKYTPINVWCKVMNTSGENPTVDEQKAIKAMSVLKQRC